MKVEVRLFAGLRDALPDAPRGRGTLDLEEATSLWELLHRLEIEPRMAQMVLVTGVQTPRDRASRQAHRLADGDVVAIFPPVAGG